MIESGPFAAEAVWLLPSAATVIVYAIGVIHLIDAARRQRPYEREDDWLQLAIYWPLWLVAGAAALTLLVANRVVNRRGLVEGGRS